MAYYDDKVKKLIVIPTEVDEALKRIAEEEDRSVNNLILTILKKYIDKREGAK